MINNTTCCGVKDYNGLCGFTPKQVLQRISRSWFERRKEGRGAFLMFTDVNGVKKGLAVKKYIEDSKLGTVTKSPSRKNPNSRNKITVFLWAINKQKFYKWAKDNHLEV